MVENIKFYKNDIDKLLELLLKFRKRNQTEDYRTTVDSIGLLVNLIISSTKSLNTNEHNEFFDNLGQSIDSEIESIHRETMEDLNFDDVKSYQRKLRSIKQLMSVKSSFPLRTKVDVVKFELDSVSDTTKKAMQKSFR
ncbi:hypothetical protein [Paenibacillus xylanexedens]|uniref:hypothetical protein n=1 Tax=Paenibacillus xylanexedens TaxID=528191 RepID=UPI0011A5D714|nr:hypothetical protein [Paenibacillus xylanexedens]